MISKVLNFVTAARETAELLYSQKRVNNGILILRCYFTGSLVKNAWNDNGLNIMRCIVGIYSHAKEVSLGNQREDTCPWSTLELLFGGE